MIREEEFGENYILKRMPSDGTEIRRQREVKMKIRKGETEKQARRKLGIWQLVYMRRVKYVEPKH